eukprot:479040-Rhodomonas_salina.4
MHRTIAEHQKTISVPHVTPQPIGRYTSSVPDIVYKRVGRYASSLPQIASQARRAIRGLSNGHRVATRRKIRELTWSPTVWSSSTTLVAPYASSVPHIA